MDGHPIKQVDHIKLVGFTTDSKLTWGLMIDDIAKKARKRIAALYRMSTSLDSGNLKLMYTSFIRFILEYGSVQWMGAAPSHLAKLDRVQAAAERIGGFKVESLVVRREAAVLALNFKLLDGKGRGILQNQMPTLMNNHTHSKCTRLASDSTGIQIKNIVTHSSLDSFKRCSIGVLPDIWKKIPQDLLKRGQSHGWTQISKRA